MKIKPDFLMRAPMLLILLLMTLLCTQPLSAQPKELSVNLTNKTIKDVFNAIQEQSDYRFFYSDDVIDLNALYSISFSNKSIQEALDILQSKTRLSFKIVEEKLIVVSNVQMDSSSFRVQGRIVSATNKESLPGVNIVIQGTTIGQVCNMDGNYSIEVPSKDAVLEYSFIGFKKQEVPVNGRSVINISLEEDVGAIAEVVVTALNISRDKNSLGYSVSQIQASDFNQAKENNPINSLTGKVAGLQITKSPTGVDGSSRVVLRGIASLQGNNRPLFVIDGIPMDAGYGGAGRWGGKDGGDALSDLNPENIASISVLKGAGAAAAYGSRGANGVILIMTKKGKERDGIGISFSSGFTLENPMVVPDLQNKYGQGAFGIYPNIIDGNPPHPLKDYPWIWSYGPRMDDEPRIGWNGEEVPFSSQGNSYRDFFRTGSSFTNTVAFDAGNETTTFRASITNQDSKGIMPNNDLSRQTINLRGASKFGKNIDLDSKITYIRSVVNNRPYLAEDGANIVQTLGIMPRNISLESLKNNITDTAGNEMKWNTDNTFSNPYWILDKISNEDEKHRLQSMFSVNWKLSDQLNLLARSGFDFYSKTAKDQEAPGRPNLEVGRGSLSQSMSQGMEWNTDVMATYNQAVGAFNLSLSAGGNYRYNQGKSLSQWGNVMRVPDFYNIKNFKNYGTGEWFSEKEVFSLYGLGQFSFQNYLYLDVTFRNDWSSTLPLQNNSYSYHSENLSFLFTEAFGLKSSILSSGKLRTSYAKVGNDTGPYQINQYYSVYQTQTDLPLGGIGGQLPHYDLQPEDTYSWEVGTNLGFFNNRLSLDVTYYNSLSVNQIMPITLTPSTGYVSKFMNAGKIENTGFEAQINASPVVSDGLNWDIILTWSKNNSTVKELYEDMQTLPLADEFHMTIEARPGQPYGVIYTTDYKRDSFGNVLIDKDGYTQAGEKKAMGNINPDWIGGISNSLSYKNLKMSFLVDVQMGGDVYSWGKAYYCLFGTGAETLEGREEWYATHDPATYYTTPLRDVEPKGFIEEGIMESTGQPNSIPIDPQVHWYSLFNQQIGTEWIQDATNVRLREVVLGYNLPKRWLERTPLSNLSLSLVGRNLLFLYRAMDHVDPESGYSSGNTGNGIEHMSLPSTSSYGFNLTVNF
ncbi:SusC/RagA family TonB-linked outer membrane protein [Sunxiuqinia sp. sy24]|uniref:SusC/RagA family TonB-linked outer membrane protein n=1 Tax=Sunxiuqinia sp. sy24 TaxID=3461495 RepID=UPI004045D2F5